MSTKKRKADDLSQEEEEEKEDGDTQPSVAAEDVDGHGPVVPATCLASVLNFLPYDYVRESLLAGKAIAVDAAGHIETLNVTSTSELCVPAARRFSNVREVNIMCIVWGGENDDGSYYQCLNVDAVEQTIPFLSTFPKLRRAFWGGRRRLDVYEPFFGEDTGDITSPEDHRDVFRFFIESMCGAFKAMALPRNLELAGVLGGKQRRTNICHPVREDVETPCRLCRSICKNFPLEAVMRLRSPNGVRNDRGDVCISDVVRLGIMRARPGGAAYFESKAATKFMLETLSRSLDFLTPETNTEGDAFMAKMLELCAARRGDGAAQEEVSIDGVIFCYPVVLEYLETLVKFGCSPSSISKQELYKVISDADIVDFSTIENCPKIWDKSTWNRLIAMGFPFDAEDAIFVDTTNEPGLNERDIIDKYKYFRWFEWVP